MGGYLGLDIDRVDVTFGGFVADLARRYGDGEALAFGDRRITFRRLEEEVRQFARALPAAGVAKVLASYKVPKRVVFVDRDELSYTATEKAKFAEARRVAAQHVATEDSDRGEHLRAAHSHLLAGPAGTVS